MNFTAKSSEVRRLKIAKTDRIVVTEKPLVLRYGIRPQPNTGEAKPLGLWYACGREWLDWTIREHFRAKFNHAYRLHIDLSYLLMLRTLAELDLFNKQYATRRIVGLRWPNWHTVSQAYAGIEICPYQWKRRFEYSWYYGWDIASGCIWDTNIVQEVEQLL